MKTIFKVGDEVKLKDNTTRAYVTVPSDTAIVTKVSARLLDVDWKTKTEQMDGDYPLKDFELFKQPFWEDCENC